MKKSSILIAMLLLLSSCGESNVSSSLTSSSNNNYSSVSSSSKVSSSSSTISVKDETYYEIVNGLYVNHLPGIYSEGFELKFKYDDASSLYYTLDNYKPAKNNRNLYIEPIKIEKLETRDKKDFPLTTSVDGILANDTGGKMSSKQYINNIQIPGKYYLKDKQNIVTIRYIDKDGNDTTRTLAYILEDYKIPVVSLSMPYDKWFGSTGIYNHIRVEYEERAHLEYIDPEQNEYFYRNTQVKLGGNWTMGYPQRTLNLNFNKDENGNKQEKVKANIFRDRKVEYGEDRLEEFTRLRLHNGGNCFENYTGFNDAIVQEMMEGTNVSTTSYRPCIVYLNGEYWGLYSIREHYKDVYFETNYGVEKDDVAIYDYKGTYVFNDGDDSDFTTFFEEFDNYLNKDFKDDEVYNGFIDKYIDEDSFIDVMIANAFMCNRDFVGNNNNLRMWRTTKVDESNPYADGKLRFSLHDVDYALTDASYWNFLDPDIKDSYGDYKLFRKLLNNKNFQDKFYNRSEELIKTNLSHENACEIIDRMTEEVRPYKLDSNYRWGLLFYGQEVNGIKEAGLAGWNYEIQYAKNFVNTRINHNEELKEENGNENERNYLEAIKESFKEY